MKASGMIAIASVSFIITLLCQACTTDVQRANPYDPETSETDQAPGSVIGKVMLSGRGPADAAGVELAGRRTYSAATREGGDFEISGVVPGVYSVHVRLAGFRTLTIAGISVGIGQVTDLGEALLEPARGSITGTVSVADAERQSPGGVLVSILAAGAAADRNPEEIRLALSSFARGQTGEKPDAGAESATPGEGRGTMTGEDGSYRLDEVPLGRYNVSVYREDLAEVCVTGVEITEDGDVVTVSPINMHSASAVLKVVDAGGEPIRWTNVGEVSVQVLSFGAAAFRYADDPTALVEKSFDPMAVSFTETLDGEDGEKSIYVQFLDECERESAIYETSVILDRDPPQDASVVIAGGAKYVTEHDGTASVSFSADDGTSGVAGMKYALNGEEPDGEPIVPCLPEMVIPFGEDDGLKSIKVIFVDNAGNESPAVEDTVVKDSVAPGPQEPAIVVTGAEDGVVHSTAVELSFNFPENDRPAFMVVANNSGTEAGPWQAFASPISWTLAAGADSPRTVYARFRDEAGNMTDEISKQVLLDRTGGLSGVVALEGGADPEGVSVSIAQRGETEFAGPDGAYAFSGVPEGVYTLRFSKDGYVTAESVVLVSAGEESIAAAMTLVRERGSLKGAALLEGETSHDGIRVSAIIGAEEFIAFTGAAGGYRFDGLPAGAASLSYAKNGFLDESAIAVVEDGKTTEVTTVTLSINPCTINGEVSLEGGGSALITVTLSPGGRTATGSPYSFTDVKAGGYTVTASAIGYRPQTTAVTAVAGEPVDAVGLLLPLTRGDVTGIVLVQGGNPASDAMVTLSGASLVGQSVQRAASTGPDGTFYFQDIPAGGYTVEMSLFGYSTESTSVNIDDGTVSSAGTTTLALDPGSVAGFVFLEFSSSSTGASLTLSPGGYSAVAAVNGSYTIDGLPAGTYVLTAASSDYVDASFSVLVEPGAQTTVPDVTLSKQRGSAYGLVDVQGTTNESGASVILSGGDYSASAVTGPDGAYLFNGVPVAALAYQVTALKEGYSTARGTVSIAAGASAAVSPPTLTMVPLTGDFTVVSDDLSETPLAYVNAAYLAAHQDVAGYARVKLVLPWQDGQAQKLKASLDSSFGDASLGDTDWRPAGYSRKPKFDGKVSPDGAKTIHVVVEKDGDQVVMSSSLTIDTQISLASFAVVDENGAGITRTRYPGVYTKISASGAEEMAVTQVAGSNCASVDCSASGGYTDYDSSARPFMLGGADGSKQTCACVKDHAGNTAKAGASISLDTTPPQSPVVVVNDDDEWTDSANVSLAFTVDDPGGTTKMLVSNCSDFGSAAGCGTPGDWVSVTSPYAWTLDSSSDGMKTVYVKFRDDIGNESAVAHDSVTLDTEPPEIADFQIDFDGTAGASATASVSVSLYTEAGDTSGQTLTAAFLNDLDGDNDCTTGLNFNTAAFQPLSLYTTFLLVAGDGEKTVCAMVRDMAGNESGLSGNACGNPLLEHPECDVIFLDTEQPEPPAVKETDAITSEPVFLIHVAGQPADPAPSSGGLAYEVRGGQYPNWKPASGAPPFSFTLRQNAYNRLGVRVKDAAGNASYATEITVRHDDVPPFPPFVISATQRKDTITVKWQKSTSGDVANYLLYYGNFPGSYFGTFALEGPSPINVGKATEARITGLPDLSTVYFTVASVDEAGIEGEKSNEVSASVYQTSPTVMGFSGGEIYSLAASGERLFVDTRLGTESYTVSDPAAMRQNEPYYSPLGLDIETKVKGKSFSFDGNLFAVKRDRVDIYDRDLSPVGFVPFEAPEQFTNVSVMRSPDDDEVVYAYLAGKDAVKVFDVSNYAWATALGKLDPVDEKFDPMKIDLQRLDDGRRVLYAVSVDISTSYIFAVDVTDPETPVLIDKYVLMHPVQDFAAHKDGLYAFDGTMEAMTFWVRLFRLNASNEIEEVCAPDPLDQCWGQCGEAPSANDCTPIRSQRRTSRMFVLDGAPIKSPAVPALFTAGSDDFFGEYIQAYDITDMVQPQKVGEIDVSARIRESQAITANDADVFVANAKGILQVQYDSGGGFTMRAHRKHISSAYGNGETSGISYLDDRLLALAEVGPGTYNNVFEVDVSDPRKPAIVHAGSLGLDTMKLKRARDTAFAVTGGAFFAYLNILDVSDIENPVTLSTLGAGDGHDFDFDGDTLIMSAPNGLAVYDVASPAVPVPKFNCSVANSAGAVRAVSKSNYSNVFFVSIPMASPEGSYGLAKCEPDFTTASCACTPVGSFSKEIWDIEQYDDKYLFVASENLVMTHEVNAVGGDIRSVLALPKTINSIEFAGNYLAVLAEDATYLVDASDPFQLKLAGKLDENIACSSIAVDRTMLYCFADGVIIYDLANPVSPSWKGQIGDDYVSADFVPREQIGVSIARSATGVDRLRRFSTADPAGPEHFSPVNEQEITRYGLTDFETYMNGLYLIDGSMNMTVYDTASAPDFKQSASMYMPGVGRDILAASSFLYDVFGGSSIYRYDLSDPLAPAYESYWEILVPPESSKHYYSLAANDAQNRIYASAHDGTGSGAATTFEIFPLDLSFRMAYFDTFPGYNMYISQMDHGSCNGKPCVAAVEEYNQKLYLIDVTGDAPQLKKVYCGYSFTGCAGTVEEKFSNLYQAVMSPSTNRLYTAAYSNFSIWQVNADWSLTNLGTRNEQCQGLYVDETNGKAYCGTVDANIDPALMVIDISTPGNIGNGDAVVKRMGYAGLGNVTMVKRNATPADGILLGFGSRSIRWLENNFAAPNPIDKGGYAEITKPGKLLKGNWYYYTGAGRAQWQWDLDPGFIGVLSDNETTAGPDFFNEEYAMQYAPRSRVVDFQVRSDRLYACRQQNADETSGRGDGNGIGFEVLDMGYHGERPKVIGAFDAACSRIAVNGDIAWVHDGAATLYALDLSDETAIGLIGSISSEAPLFTGVDNIETKGPLAYVGLGGGAIKVYKVEGGQIVEKDQIAPIDETTEGGVFRIFRSGDFLYSTQLPSFFGIYKIPGVDGANPHPIASLSGNTGYLSVDGAFAYVTSERGGTIVVDLR